MAPSGVVTVAGRSVADPGHANEDRYSTSLDAGDGSWVAADAAEAAISDLPRSIDSTDAMWEAFTAAGDRVAALSAYPGEIVPLVAVRGLSLSPRCVVSPDPATRAAPRTSRPMA